MTTTEQARREAALEQAIRNVAQAKREGRILYVTTELYRLLGQES